MGPCTPCAPVSPCTPFPPAPPVSPVLPVAPVAPTWAINSQLVPPSLSGAVALLLSCCATQLEPALLTTPFLAYCVPETHGPLKTNAGALPSVAPLAPVAPVAALAPL